MMTGGGGRTLHARPSSPPSSSSSPGLSSSAPQRRPAQSVSPARRVLPLLVPLLFLLLCLLTTQGHPLSSSSSPYEGDIGVAAHAPRRWSRAQVLQQVVALLEEEEEVAWKRRSSLLAGLPSSTDDLHQPSNVAFGQSSSLMDTPYSSPHAPSSPPPLPSHHRRQRRMADVPVPLAATPPAAPALPMEGVFLRIGVVIEPPLVTKKGNASATKLAANGELKITQAVWPNSAYGGLIMDVLRSHSFTLGFTYQIVEPSDGFFGVLQENGSYNGLMGLYQRGEVDILYSGLHVNAERAKLIDFTQSYLPSGYKILTKPIKRETNVWFVLSPFDYTLWLAILGMVVVMALIFKLIDTASPYGKRVHSAPSWLYHACGVLLNVDSFQSINHHGFAASILTMVWTFSALAIVTLYTANMVSNLTVQRLEAPVHSVNDIIRKQAKVATIASSASRAWTLDHYPALANLEVQYKTFGAAVQGLRAGQVEAVVFVTAVVEAVARRPPCDLMTTGETFGATFIGVGVRPGSSYFDDINSMVFQQITSGDIEKFTASYLSDECAAGDPGAGTETIKVQDVRGLFYILGIGIAIAFFCLLVQVVRYRFVIRRFGLVLYQNDLNENSFMRMFVDDSPKTDDSLLLTRKVKLALLKLGMTKYEIQVILSACDTNTDGFLDPYELEHLKLIARRALATHKDRVSPYNLNVNLWRLNSRALSFSERSMTDLYGLSGDRRAGREAREADSAESKNKDFHSLYVAAVKD